METLVSGMGGQNFSDVLVVGGGPTGMLLAAELARRNVGVRLIEKREGPAEHSRALGVMPRTLEMFESLGLVDEFLAGSHQVQGIQIHGKKRKRLLAEMNLRHLSTRYPCILLLPQTQTEAILRRYLEKTGGAVDWRNEFVGYREEAAGLRVEVKSRNRSEEFGCRYLVGCDGAHSGVRKATGLEFQGAAYQQNWYLADVSLEPQLDPRFMHLFLCSTGPIIIFPLPENVWRVVAMRPGTVQDASRAKFQEIVDLLERNELGHLRPHHPLWVAGFSIHHRHTQQLRRGRVFLCGDAAHIHSPAGGQGMNTGLGDAFNLGWKLASFVQGKGTELLLESYERERLPVIEGVLELTDRMTRMMTAAAGPAVWIRDWVMPWAARLGMGEKMGERLSQLQVAYPHSSAVLPDGRGERGAVSAGSRIPPLMLKNQASGKDTWLSQITSTGRLGLLVFPTGSMRGQNLRELLGRGAVIDWHWVVDAGVIPEEICSGDGVWIDTQGEVRRALGDLEHASWALLRSDGILMGRGEVCETRLLGEFLDRLFGASAQRLGKTGP